MEHYFILGALLGAIGALIGTHAKLKAKVALLVENAIADIKKAVQDHLQK